jgi:hypothetical protein
VASIAEMASKGEAKLRRKATSMAASYDAAKGRAKTNYAAAGFGPTRQANYSAGIDAATYHAPDPGKWNRNWSAKMAE